MPRRTGVCHTHTYIHTYIHTHIHTYIHTYVHAQCPIKHTYKQAHIHTYIHTHTHTHSSLDWGKEDLVMRDMPANKFKNLLVVFRTNKLLNLLAGVSR